ncbi:MAG: hypothetical protein ACR2G5_13055 [Pyrinomonadaceae bacterium]
MQRFLPLLACAAIFITLNVASALAQTPQSDSPLTNAAIVKLVKAGFKEKTVVTIIGNRPANFDMSTERMIELKRGGVSERIILAMLASQEGSTLPDDFWNDDAFFGKETNAVSKNPDKTADPNSTGSMDIFGSSGGSSASTKSRGRNSSGSSETMTTGSATVRIIRPPSEADTPAKLEKTTSLTNDSIVELVEAGFSEGTIIRRIQRSPVEFNLSPDRLDQLRKHRVSDKILSAMKSAMGDEPSISKNPPGSNVTPK